MIIWLKANQTGNEISSLQSELSDLKKDFENASNRSRALEKQNGTLKKELRSALASSGSKSGMTRTQVKNFDKVIKYDSHFMTSILLLG